MEDFTHKFCAFVGLLLYNPEVSPVIIFPQAYTDNSYDKTYQDNYTTSSIHKIFKINPRHNSLVRN
jgi:hypothetical protein